MPRGSRKIIGDVDTHTATHHAAVIDLNGRSLADAAFPASPRGYASLLVWMRSKGELVKVGIEGTGAYGAGLARHLHRHGVSVLEVPRPDRRVRPQHGKE
jgi:transposase